MKDWKIFEGNGKPGRSEKGLLVERLPLPPWRDFSNRDQQRRESYQPPPGAVEVVNAALYLRRPILVTGQPGTGKSSLIYAVAHELELGSVLSWPINSRSTLSDGLYRYDAVARLRQAQIDRHSDGRSDRHEVAAAPRGAGAARDEEIGRFIKLGPLGTAFLPDKRPRALLIDEIDKSDVDLPNDLLHIFEEGAFEIPELQRISHQQAKIKVAITDPSGKEVSTVVEHGRVGCEAFPFVVITSNGERDLPPAFLRRCLRLDIDYPDAEQLGKIVSAHLGQTDLDALQALITAFRDRQKAGAVLATDQLLNTIFMLSQSGVASDEKRAELEAILLRELEER